MNRDDLDAAVRVGKVGARIFIALDLIDEVASQKVKDLEADALRTIRQRDTAKGEAILNEIEGVQKLLDQLKLAAGSMIGRQRGLVLDKAHTPVADRIVEIRQQQKNARKARA